MPSRVDANQAFIVDALRAIGATVLHLHEIGEGAPDILVGYRGKNYLLEIKHGKGELNPRQIEWHAKWRGQVDTIWDIDEAFLVIGLEWWK